MRLLVYLLSLLSFTSAAERAAATDVGCPREDQLVVFGKIERQEYIDFVDDLGMNIVMEARLFITRVESGHSPTPSLTMRTITHTDLPQGRELRFRLCPTTEGKYLRCSEGGRGYRCQ